MVNSKTMISQELEFQLILQKVEAEGMIFSETFQVATIWRNSHLLGEISRIT